MRKFIDAVRANRVDQVHKLLRGGLFFYPVKLKGLETFTHGEPPLHIAASLGSLPMCSLLVKYGADVDFQWGTVPRRQTWAPIKSAIDYDHTEVVALLLDSGADTQRIVKNADSNTSESALIYAAKNGAIGTLVLLVSRGIDVNGLEDDGESALHVAARNADLEVIRTLLDLNAAVNIRKADSTAATNWRPGCTALQMLSYGLLNESFFSFGLFGIARKIQRCNREPVNRNSIESLEALLSADADPNLQDHNGDTTLHHLVHAANGPDGSIIQGRDFDENKFGELLTNFAVILMKHGADPSIRNKTGKAPIDTVREGACSTVLGALLAVGKSPEFPKNGPLKTPTAAEQAKFHELFGINLNDYWDSTGFDIVKFDKYIYNDIQSQETCPADLLKEKYGQDAHDLIRGFCHS